MRRLFLFLVGLCAFSVFAVATSVLPVGGAVADESASPAATPTPTASSTDPAPADAPSSTPTSGPGSQPASPSASPSATPSATGSATPPAVRPRSSAAGAAPLAGATTPTGPTAVIDTAPPASTVSRTATFSFHADEAAAKFSCSLTRPNGTKTTPVDCTTPVTGTPTAPSKGTASYTRLALGSYTFTVQASSTTTGAGPLVTRTWKVIDDCTTVATLCPVFAPGNYSIPAGARFNNPLGTRLQRLNNIRHVVGAVNSMPGYHVADPQLCRNDASQYAGMIRISMYSFTNMDLARALVAAHRRCVSVQLLMNNHLSAASSPAIALVQQELGTYIRGSVGGKTVDRRSFAKRCSYGCRGTGVLHSKFYLFNSRLTIPDRPRIADVTMVGSSNMTGNASGVQWNDLYTVKGQKTLHDQYASMFNRMKVDRTDLRTVRYATGPYQTTFFPLTPGGSDPELSALRSIHCKGATGGAGVQGRTIVYINMHAWFGTRGQAFASQVRNLYANGCYIRILYSFMTKAVYTKLTTGTGSRMTARRTLFSDDGDKYADVYSHFKMIAVSGVIGSDHSAWAVWTGSNNFTNDGTHFDEVMFKIGLRSAFASYRDRFLYIQARKSSGTWATFLEPVGGGRAPAPPQETKALRATTSFAVQNRQVIVAPDAISGTGTTGLHALD